MFSIDEESMTQQDDSVPFLPGDEETIIDYLLSLSPVERERQAWRVMMYSVPKDAGD